MIQGFTRKRVALLIGAALVIATLVAYEPVRHNEFVKYDDARYITENPDVKRGITAQIFSRGFTQFHGCNWHPLTTLSHILDCELFGLNPPGHHIVSLLFHIANAVLLFWVLSKMTGAIWASGFVAAVFALHPLQVESVAWAAERKTVLSGLSWFLTIAVYIWYTKRPGIGRYILLLGIYALCIMTKPVVVTLPLVLLLLDYWPLERIGRRKRVDRGQMSENTFQKASAGWLLIEKIPLFTLSAVLSTMTLIAQKSGGAVVALEKIPLNYRIANMFLSYIRYIGKLIWPSALSVFYPHPRAELTEAVVVLCILTVLVITAISVWTGRRRGYAAMGWLWYVGTLVPTIGLVQAGSQAMANRYMYIPIAGLLIIAAWVVRDFISTHPHWKPVTAVSAIVVLTTLGILTRMQVRHWQNDIKLFGYARKVVKANEVVENGYGCGFFEAGQFKEAEIYFRNAIRMNPAFFDAENNLGKTLLTQGKLDKAVILFNKLVNRREVSSDVLNNLAWLLSTGEAPSAEDVNRAIEFAERACEMTGHKEVNQLDSLAAAYAAGGRFEEAVTTAQKAIDAAKAGGQDELAREIQKRKELYQAGKRYIQK
jgi:hypothetical protein